MRVIRLFKDLIKSILYGRYLKSTNQILTIDLIAKKQFQQAATYLLQGKNIGKSFSFNQDLISNITLPNFIPSKFIRFKSKENFDIKFLWDISRFQFLDAQINSQEFELFFSQKFEEFYKNNNPYWGPNWICTMDVAIRAVNIIYYHDMYCNNSTEFNKQKISNFLYTHLVFVENNLEWVPLKRGNHYLSNICGLVILNIKLNRPQEALSNLCIFLNEIDDQFNSDGTYFENSSAYHRLALEMVTYTIMYLLSAPTSMQDYFILVLRKKYNLSFKTLSDFFKIHLSEFLQKSIYFLESLTLPDGSLAQIGDNDSGRFIIRDSLYLNEFEQIYHHKNIRLSAYSIIHDTNKILEEINVIQRNKKQKYIFDTHQYEHEKIVQVNEMILELPIGEKFVFDHFKDFGIAVWKSENCHITFRTNYLSNSKFAHNHFDLLGITLYTPNLKILDKGTYVYTRNFDNRDLYRSKKSHFVPFLKNYNFIHFNGCFKSTFIGEIKLNVLNESEIFVKLSNQNRIIARKVVLKNDKLVILDFVKEEDIKNYCFTTLAEIDSIPFSPEYGVLIN